MKQLCEGYLSRYYEGWRCRSCTAFYNREDYPLTDRCEALALPGGTAKCGGSYRWERDLIGLRCDRCKFYVLKNTDPCLIFCSRKY